MADTTLILKQALEDFTRIRHHFDTDEYAWEVADNAMAYLRQALEQPADEPVAWQQELANILCRIHRDGGHYIAEHGWRKAIDDADVKVAIMNANADTRPQPAAPAKRIRVWGWVWKHKRHEDGCCYIPSYTPAQHVPKGELLALVDPADLHEPLESTMWPLMEGAKLREKNGGGV